MHDENTSAAGRTNGPEDTVARVPFMITNRMRQELRQLGYSDDLINKLQSAEAHEILETGREFMGMDRAGRAELQALLADCEAASLPRNDGDDSQ